MNPLGATAPQARGASAAGALIRRARMSPLAGRLARGTFWATAGTAAARLSLLLTTIIVGRTIGKSGLGAFGIVLNTVSMFQVAAGLGMGLAATKYVAEHRRSDPDAAGQIIGLSLFVTAASSIALAAGLLAAAPWLAAHTLAAPELASELRVSGGILVSTSLLAAAAGALSGFEAFRLAAIANALTGAVTIPAVYFGVRSGGLEGAVWGLFASSAFGAFIMVAALWRRTRLSGVRVRVPRDAAGWRPVRDFGLPATLSGLVVAPVNWTCAALLVNSAGGYEQMGIYNAANSWRIAIFYIPIVFGQVLTPVLAERAGARDDASLRRLVSMSMAAMGLACAVPVALVVLLSPTVMGLYGNGFEGNHGVLIVLAATALVMAVLSPVGNVIAATGRMWVGFTMNLGWGIAALGITWILLDRGALGLALGQLGAYLVHSVWSIAFARRAILRRAA